MLKKIGAYCAQPDFQPDIIGRVSLAAKSLCMWVRAMEVSGGVRAASSEPGLGRPQRPQEKAGAGEEAPGVSGRWVKRCPAVFLQLYGRLYRVVEPKRVRLNAALAQLQEKQAALAEAQEKLREVSLMPSFAGCPPPAAVSGTLGDRLTLLPGPSQSCLPPTLCLVYTGRLWLRKLSRRQRHPGHCPQGALEPAMPLILR